MKCLSIFLQTPPATVRLNIGRHFTESAGAIAVDSHISFLPESPQAFTVFLRLRHLPAPQGKKGPQGL